MKLWTVKKGALKQIDAVGIAICLMASGAVYFAVLNPIMTERSFLAGRRDELAVRREESSRLSASMLGLTHQLADVRQRLENNTIRLESSGRTNQRLAALTELFTDCSLAVDDIQAGEITTGPMWNLVPIGISGRGEYTQCIALLRRLRRTFADMSVARFRLEGHPAKSDEFGRFRFQLIWHTLPDAQEAGK